MIAGKEDLLAAGVLMGIGILFTGNSLFYIFRWKNLAYFTLGVVFLGLGYLSFYTGIVKSGIIYKYPLLFGTDLAVITVVVYAMYFHMAEVLNTRFQWKSAYWLLLLYPLFLLVSLFIHHYNHSAEMTEFIRDKVSSLAISFFPEFIFL